MQKNAGGCGYLHAVAVANGVQRDVMVRHEEAIRN